MKIVYTDIIRKDRAEAELPARYYESLVEMVSECDAVVIATPSLPKSAPSPYLLTAEVLSHFKKGSRFINIARGSLVDSNALADALESGHIAAAGIDVFEDEPRINERFINMQNVEMTCHNGGGALETWMMFEALAIQNVSLVLNDEEPLTAVNKHLIPVSEKKGMNSVEETNSEETKFQDTKSEETKVEVKETPKGKGFSRRWRLWL